MEVKVLEKESINAKIQVNIPATEVSDAFKTVLRSVARQVKIPGFRPGRAPRGVLIKHVGEDLLKQEVKEHLVEKSLAKALRDHELVAVDMKVDAKDAVDNTDFSYEVVLELYPEISLPSLSDIIIDTEKEDVSPEELEEALEHLQHQNAILVPVDREVKVDDQLMIEIVRDEESENTTMPIDLAAVAEVFALQFIGKKIGEIFEVDLDAPEGEDEVKINMKINDIKEKELAELNDDFAKDLGLESFEELENNLRTNIQYKKDGDIFNAQREELVEKLVIETNFDLPKSIVKRQETNMLEDLKKDLEKEGRSLEEFLEEEYKDNKDEFYAEMEIKAKGKATRDLLLEQLLVARKAKISNKEFENYVAIMAERYGQKTKAFKKEMGKEWLTNYRFMLERDKALNEAVTEVLDRQNEKLGKEAEAKTKKKATTVNTKKIAKKAAKKTTTKKPKAKKVIKKKPLAEDS